MRDRALILFLYNTGARVSEAAGVRAGHLDLGGHPIVRLHGKGGKWRTCPLWQQTARTLTELLASLDPAPGSDSAVFTAHGRPLTRSGIYKIVRRHTCGFDDPRTGRKITPHTFRHTAVTRTVSTTRTWSSGTTRRCLANIRYLCDMLLRCVRDRLIDLPFRPERAVSSLDGAELWVVLDPGLSCTGRPATSCGRCTGRAVRLTRSVPMPGGWRSSWAGALGRGWSGPDQPAAPGPLEHFIEVTPGRGGRLRSGATVYATLTAVREFLRFCVRTGLI